MKVNLFILIQIWVTFFCAKAFAQQTTQLIPEFSLGQPVGAFSQDNFGAKKGFGGGLHLDRLNIWKDFGLGLYVGYNQNESEFTTPFPNDIDDSGFRSRLLVEAKDLNWSSLQFGLGPLYNLNLSDKLSLQAYSKFGFAKVNYPEYRYYVSQTLPVQQEYTLFQTSEPEDLDSNFKLMALSGLRFNYSLSNRIGLSLGVNYLHIKGLTHTYTTRNLQITGNETSDILFETLANTTETTKTYECHINTINGTVGIIINIGGGTPNEDPVDEEPETPTENYDCTAIIYESPGYNTPIVLDKKAQIIFQWTDKNARTVKEDKAYQLLFFIKENGEYKEVERRIMNSKRRFKIGLSPNKRYPNNELFWQIIPIDVSENEFCPEPTKLMRLLVFKNQEEANEKLPQCLLQGEQNTDTDAFRKYAPKK